MSSSSNIGGGGPKTGASPTSGEAIPSEEVSAENVASEVAAAEVDGGEESEAAKAVRAETKAKHDKEIGTDTVTRKLDQGLLAPKGGGDLGPYAGDQELIKLFASALGTNPVNSQTTPKVHEQLQQTESYGQTVSALQGFLEDPSPANLSEFQSRMRGLASEFPHGNIMEVLFLVFKDSIEEVNEDKKYFLKKLMMYNDMAEGLSEYLQELLPASDELGKKIASAKSEDAGMQTVSVNIKNFDLTTTGADGKLQQIGPTKTENMNQMSLGNRIKEVESMQETVRNKRQMASTAFQNFDQKGNQLYNLLSSVLKGMGEMRMGTTRNML